MALDDVTAPASDIRLFRSSPTWLALTIIFTAVPVMALASTGLELADGAAANGMQLTAAVFDMLPYALGIALVAAWKLRRRRTWVRISSGGIELAAHGGDPVLLDWSEIVSARVRHRWLWADLEVVPVDLDAVRSVEPRRDLPPVQETDAGAAFIVEAGSLRPGPAALRAELVRRAGTGGEKRDGR